MPASAVEARSACQSKPSRSGAALRSVRFTAMHTSGIAVSSKVPRRWSLEDARDQVESGRLAGEREAEDLGVSLRGERVVKRPLDLGGAHAEREVGAHNRANACAAHVVDHVARFLERLERAHVRVALGATGPSARPILVRARWRPSQATSAGGSGSAEAPSRAATRTSEWPPGARCGALAAHSLRRAPPRRAGRHLAGTPAALLVLDQDERTVHVLGEQRQPFPAELRDEHHGAVLEESLVEALQRGANRLARVNRLDWIRLAAAAAASISGTASASEGLTISATASPRARRCAWRLVVALSRLLRMRVRLRSMRGERAIRPRKSVAASSSAAVGTAALTVAGCGSPLTSDIAPITSPCRNFR